MKLIYIYYMIILTVLNFLWTYSNIQDKLLRELQDKSIVKYYICKHLIHFLKITTIIYLRYCVIHIIYSPLN
jgi:hypothetical protein